MPGVIKEADKEKIPRHEKIDSKTKEDKIVRGQER